VDADTVAKAKAVKSEHKALGVVCFGYFRYRNARFGCAEVHQAIQAYGRAGMTRAREVAQADGYEMVHTMTDCAFLQKRSVTRADGLRVARKITDAVGVPMDVEGVYKWIVFLPSKTHSRDGDAMGVGVPNRYYGKFEDGTLKVRGIEVQRHSTPPWIYDVQQGMLDVFAEADDAAGFLARIPRALAVAKRAAERLRARTVPAEELAQTLQTRMEVEDYAANTGTRAALKRLRDDGIDRRPGQYVRYVVARREGPWDGRVIPLELLGKEGWFGGDARTAVHIDAHLRLLARSVETMLSPFGYSEGPVLDWLRGRAASPRAAAPRPASSRRIDREPRPEFVAV
jgi:DNA polymerase-2